MTTQTTQEERGPSLVPPPIAAVASFVIPGSGQALARELWRGLLILGAMISIVGMFIWQATELGRRVTGTFAQLQRAFERRPVFFVFMVLGIVVLWLLNVWDAYRKARSPREGVAWVFVMILVLLFVLGWQVAEIDLVKAATEITDVWPNLSRVLWPWEAAITREEQTLSARAPIEVPCDDDPPDIPERVEGEPYIQAQPTCGELSDFDEQGERVPGTALTVTADNFLPNTETEIWWEDPLGHEFQIREEGEYLTVQTDSEGSFEMEVIMPYRVTPPSAEGTQEHAIIARQVAGLGPVMASEPLLLSIGRMTETIVMGMMATLFGIIFAVPASFLAAKNLMSGSWFSLGIYYITRAVMNIVRSIEPLIWAIIAAQWVGLGPFAGIIALVVHTVAALGKLYSEAIESIDPGPIEAIQATGANQLQTIMYAVVPQMIPPFVSFSIYRWDINVRLSTVIGLVGGGGIGFLLIQYIRLLNFRAAGIAVWFIAITVAILDYVSAEIRERFV